MTFHPTLYMQSGYFAIDYPKIAALTTNYKLRITNCLVLLA
ncbi:hypothetical protein FDUTEX481_08647 [Tolypothrix sp. PCC 7601]|nr:hypothetical protein FDUTEX481_08647 [Tolypothrix sp. PCC 7601]